MSRAYRIRVKESVNQDLSASDEVCSDLEILEILPGDQMAELVAKELKDRGYVEKVEVRGEVDHAHYHEHHLVIQGMRDALEAEIENQVAARLQITGSQPKLTNGHAKRGNGSGGNGSSSAS